MKKTVAFILAVLFIVTTLVTAIPVFAEEIVITKGVESDWTFDGIIRDANGNETTTPTFTATGVGGYGEVWVVENVVKGSVFSYTLTIETAGIYAVSIASRLHDKGFGEFQLLVDGAAYGSYKNLYESGNYYATYSLGEVELTAGEHTIAFKAIGSGARGREDNNVWGADVFTLTKVGEIGDAPSFSKGTLTQTALENPAVIKHEVESGYIFVDENGADQTATKTYTNTSTGGYGGQLSVFYDVIAGSYFEYTVTFDTAGTYAATILSRTHNNGWGLFTLSVDGETIGSYSNQNTSIGNYSNYALGSFTVTAGEHKIRFTASGTGAVAYGKENNNCWGADYFTLTQVSTDYTVDSDDFSAFISARKADEGKHDLRFVMAADLQGLDSYAALYMTVTFLDADGNTVKSLVKNVATDLKIFASAMAAGNRYVAADGAVLFGCVITDIPDSVWASVTVTLGTTAEADSVIAKGSIDAASVIG